MKRNSLYIAAFALLLSCGLLCSCKDDEPAIISCEMEQPTVDEGNTKMYLGHGEEWMFWESGDYFHASFEEGKKKGSFTLTSGEHSMYGVFRSSIEANSMSSPAYAVANATAVFNNETGVPETLVFPASQEYRKNDQGTHPDSSFGASCMPMVAYVPGGASIHDGFYFHVVAGLIRIQLYSDLPDSVSIKEISFTENSGEGGNPNKKISGTFKIVGAETYTPYLSAQGIARVTGDDKITITNINAFEKDGKPYASVGQKGRLLTFYLALPAMGANAYTEYCLTMKVTNRNDQYYVKKFYADVHRRNITFMPAINISSWTSNQNDPTTTGSTDVSIVGCGTKDRPFEIYKEEELVMLRDAVNNGTKINGQLVNSKTYIQISRSDMTLNSTNWTSGFRNFKSYMYFASSSATQGGITNQSGVPIFESIADSGIVERLNVKGTYTYQGAHNTNFSAFCNVNAGKIIDCHNQCNITAANGANLAGICVTNESKGSIIGGANEANLTSIDHGDGKVSGICLYNNGSIQGNFTLSSALPKGDNVAGICFQNNASGIVKDCQISANAYQMKAVGNWGGIVYDNRGTIDNCVSSGTVIFSTTGSIGGICNINSGTVKNCSNRVTRLEGKAGSSAGIVGTMNSGVVYNSFNAANASVVGYQRGANVSAEYGGNAGGIVGRLNGGYVANCYNRGSVTTATNSGGIVGVVFGGTVVNCYNGNGKNFCGGIGSSDVVLTDHLKANCYTQTGEDGCSVFTATEVHDAGGNVIMDQGSNKRLNAVLNDWVANPNPSLSTMGISTSNPQEVRNWLGCETNNFTQYPYLDKQSPQTFRDDTKGKHGKRR